MSKGSAQRPRSVADEEWASRWNSIFGKDSVEDFKLSVNVDKYLPIETLRSEHERDRNLLASDKKEES
tara:strand:+ start:1985 stop:2188 length:204 start_codon:yes stop_codon:yes gene_type:complete